VTKFELSSTRDDQKKRQITVKYIIHSVMKYSKTRTCAVRGQKSFPLNRSIAFERQVQLIRRGHDRMWALGTAKPSQRLRIWRRAIVERDVIVSAFLVRFHFKGVKKLLKTKTKM